MIVLYVNKVMSSSHQAPDRRVIYTVDYLISVEMLSHIISHYPISMHDKPVAAVSFYRVCNLHV